MLGTIIREYIHVHRTLAQNKACILFMRDNEQYTHSFAGDYSYSSTLSMIIFSEKHQSQYICLENPHFCYHLIFNSSLQILIFHINGEIKRFDIFCVLFSALMLRFEEYSRKSCFICNKPAHDSFKRIYNILIGPMACSRRTMLVI